MMRRFLILLLLGGLSFVLLSPAQAGERPVAVIQASSHPRDIAFGDPLRKPILDALRGVVEKDLEQPVRFVVKKLRVQQGWAFAVVLPQTPAGRIIDFAHTRRAEQWKAGILDGDGLTFALLRMQGGKWVVREYDLGPTDVSYVLWPEDHGAPASLFGLTEDGEMIAGQ